MTEDTFKFGFRVLGPATEARRLINWIDAFRGYAACDPRAEVSQEAYLSAFCFGGDFVTHLRQFDTVRGFTGSTWSSWIWFDIDGPTDGERFAVDSAARLAFAVTERLGIPEEQILIFFSGSKGFHLGVPTAAWAPPPGPMYHKIARSFCSNLAAATPVTVDTGVYDRVRIFRAPNSRHPRTGLFKRRLSVDEVMHLKFDAICQLAQQPESFDIPSSPGTSTAAANLWSEATARVLKTAEAMNARRTENNGDAKLNRATLEFIRDGAAPGGNGPDADKAAGVGRHRLLFSSAANLGEFGCPAGLAHALLTESALDSGLPPSDVRRTIDDGLRSVQLSNIEGGVIR